MSNPADPERCRRGECDCCTFMAPPKAKYLKSIRELIGDREERMAGNQLFIDALTGKRFTNE